MIASTSGPDKVVDQSFDLGHSGQADLLHKHLWIGETRTD